MSRGMIAPPKRRDMVPPPKMTTKQAEIFWNNLTVQQKTDFAKMYPKLINGELMLTNVNVDDNETIMSIELAEKNKPSAPDKPFYSHFK